MTKYAIIVAGGSGLRMGSTIPKQFLLLNKKPVLYHTLKVFLDAFADLSIILVLHPMYLQEGTQIIDDLQATDRIRTVGGGQTRFDSVKNGLSLVEEPSIVFVHDAVRCLVTRKLIHRCFEQALAKGSAIPAIPATDSIRIEKDGGHYVEDRNHIRIIQTPQTFNSSLLLAAFTQPFNPSFTDEATVVEAGGNKVYLVDGEYQNLKITRPIDLVIAEKILNGAALFEQS